MVLFLRNGHVMLVHQQFAVGRRHVIGTDHGAAANVGGGGKETEQFFESRPEGRFHEVIISETAAKENDKCVTVVGRRSICFCSRTC